MMDIEHYGDSLESHPDYFFMKKLWLEDQINLEKEEESIIFVDPTNNSKSKLFKDINFILERTNKNKHDNNENILRSTMGTSSGREDN